MKNLLKILLGLFLVTFAISCDKDDATEVIPVQQFQDVVFDVNNFIPPADTAGKNAFTSGKQEGEKDPSIPDCSDTEPSYVTIDVDGILTTLQLITLNNKTQTEVLKLVPGEHNLKSFVVYDVSNQPIWASPIEGSYYNELWPDLNFVDVPFTVNEFDKLKVNVDVLCYKPYQYEEFGFAWFEYAKVEVHTVCFFGDICTKFYEEFHNESSPYFGQDYDGYDFPAIFYVLIKNADGDIVNDNNYDSETGFWADSNLSWFGTGDPLCIEYPDMIGVDESFTFEIHLQMPDGHHELVHTGTFDDTAHSGVGDDAGFGGADGIFDFVVGNCSYDGNDGDYELPAYLPIPKTADMATSWGPQGFDIFEFYMTFTNYSPAPILGLFDENVAYRTLCGEEDVDITVAANYSVEFYSSLDYLSENSLIPNPYKTYPWGSMNYFANNCESYTWQERQEAIWYIMDPTDTVLGVENQLAIDSMNNSAFVPSVGDFACVLVIPLDVETETIHYQLLLMRIDP